MTGVDIDELEATALKGIVGDPLPAFLTDLALWEQEAVEAVRALANHNRELADALRHIEQTAAGEADEPLRAFARAALDRQEQT